MNTDGITRSLEGLARNNPFYRPGSPLVLTPEQRQVVELVDSVVLGLRTDQDLEIEDERGRRISFSQDGEVSRYLVEGESFYVNQAFLADAARPVAEQMLREGMEGSLSGSDQSPGQLADLCHRLDQTAADKAPAPGRLRLENEGSRSDLFSQDGTYSMQFYTSDGGGAYFLETAAGLAVVELSPGGDQIFGRVALFGPETVQALWQVSAESSRAGPR